MVRDGKGLPMLTLEEDEMPGYGGKVAAAAAFLPAWGGRWETILKPSEMRRYVDPMGEC